MAEFELTNSDGINAPQRLRIAKLDVAHAASYRSLMLNAYQTETDAFTSTAQERTAEPQAWWIARIADPKGLSHVFGAFLGDALVGTVTLEFTAKPKIRHKAHLIGMFVSPAARVCGAGRALMQAAIGMASERPGLRVMTLTVTEGNAAAIGLYQSCGFKVFGVEPLAIAAQQGFKSKVHMWWEILPASAASPAES